MATVAARAARGSAFASQGEHDHVIPRELLDRACQYLTEESGASAIARRDPVGHGIVTIALAVHSGL